MSEPKLNIETLRPVDTPEYMTGAWLGCIFWGIGDENILAAFRQDTGNQWCPGRNGFERAIDAATGVDRQFVEAFIRWANVNVWGPLAGSGGPDV